MSWTCPSYLRLYSRLRGSLLARGMKSLALRDGMRIAYQEWGNASSLKKVVAVHGWLDNSNSFRLLAPKIAALDYHLVAIDLIGHGKSSHISADAIYTTTNGVAYLNEVVDTLGWDKPSVIGHSMGAGVSLLFAGTYPEKVEKLVLIEGLGPVTAEPEHCAKNLRRSIEADKKFKQKAAEAQGNTSKIYPTFADAVEARIKSVSTYPGSQSLSYEAAKALVARGTYRVDEATGAALQTVEQEMAAGVDVHNDLGDGAVRFRHDPRLVLSTRVYLTNEQVLSFVRGVTAPTLLISAERGWPMEEKSFAYQERRQALQDKGILTHRHMAGSHHLHLDADSEPAVSDEILRFLQ